jgi:hypothetical protein
MPLMLNMTSVYPKRATDIRITQPFRWSMLECEVNGSLQVSHRSLGEGVSFIHFGPPAT